MRFQEGRDTPLRLASKPDVRPLQDLAVNLDRVKWSLWHGNVFKALQVLDDIQMDLETVDEESTAVDKLEKITVSGDLASH